MKKIIIANWKSFKNTTEVASWFLQFNEILKDKKQILDKYEVIIAPSYPLLALVKSFIEEYQLLMKIAVQDLSPFTEGAFTGEVCTKNLQDLNVSYAIVGHSERRKNLGETDGLIGKKIVEAVNVGITPILCLDEAYIDSQRAILDEVYSSKIIAAYEPIYAISTTPGAKNADPEQIKVVLAKIKQLFQNIPVTYGGSVDDTNINHYTPITDGVLVGGASLDPVKFANLILNISS